MECSGRLLHQILSHGTHKKHATSQSHSENHTASNHNQMRTCLLFLSQPTPDDKREDLLTSNSQEPDSTLIKSCGPWQAFEAPRNWVERPGSPRKLYTSGVSSIWTTLEESCSNNNFWSFSKKAIQSQNTLNWGGVSVTYIRNESYIIIPA